MPRYEIGETVRHPNGRLYTKRPATILCRGCFYQGSDDCPTFGDGIGADCPRAVWELANKEDNADAASMDAASEEFDHPYMRLIAIVDTLDKAAAEYLMTKAMYLDGFKAAHRLSPCFCWSETPQGHRYWANLSERVERIRNG